MSSVARFEIKQQTTREEGAFPVSALLALALTGFTCIVTETLPAGLLPQISQGLGIPLSLAGQSVTAYAIGSLLSAIPLTLATRAWRRRKVLLLSITGFLVFNTVTALSSSFPLTLAARFFAGAAAGLAWSLLAGYARRMVSVTQQGKAMALAMVGTPMALSLGVPLGTWLGGAIGWRFAFAAMSLLTIALVIWVVCKVPDYPGEQGRAGHDVRSTLKVRGVRPVLVVVLAWMLAHNALYTYVAPLIAPSGLASEIGLVLLAFGAAALAGIYLTSRFVDTSLRRTVLMSLAAFATISLAMALWIRVPVVMWLAVIVWGMSFGGAATLIQTALADAAGSAADVALSLNVVTWNAAIAGGGIVGGLLLEHAGPLSLPWTALILSLVALVCVYLSRSHGFPPGARRPSSR